ncbi:MAG: hypothetical protein QOI98_3646 [Solirubrobacteraceae bacterium]|nr:hypothetical protein [Solirubrobacteraceae bacterium]
MPYRVLLACLILACTPASALAADPPDTTAPTTTIAQKPSVVMYFGETGYLKFSANETATFECRLDAGAWSACASPYTIHADAFGRHHINVRATDLAGNVEATPPDFQWDVNGAMALARPKISGNYALGQQLTCADAQWSSPPSSIAMTWKRNGNLAGSGPTYTITNADLGQQFQCEVEAAYTGHGALRSVSEEFPKYVGSTLSDPVAPVCLSSSRASLRLTDDSYDAWSYTPDLRGARVTLDEGCRVRVETTLTRPYSYDQVGFYLDTDGNAGTGDPKYGGADRLVTHSWGATESALLSKWRAANNAFVPYSEIASEASYERNTISWSTSFAELGFVPGATARLRIVSGRIYGDQNHDYLPEMAQPMFGFLVNFATPPTAEPPATVTTVVSPAPVPAGPKATKAPRLTGSARVGKRLSCSAGTWTGTPRLTYSWKRKGKAIKGSKKKTYTVRATDRRRKLTCSVTARNAGGTKTVTSKSIWVK